MKIETPPLVFIVAIPKRFGKLYVKVHVYDRRDQMLRGIAAMHGGHDHETASTVIEPLPVRGRMADMFFTFRCARPGIIAHESMHAAWACTKFIWGVGEDSEEYFAQIAERLTDRIWTRIHGSRLA